MVLNIFTIEVYHISSMQQLIISSHFCIINKGQNLPNKMKGYNTPCILLMIFMMTAGLVDGACRNNQKIIDDGQLSF